MGLKYFLQLDDDYMRFTYRYVEDDKLRGKRIKDLDRLFTAAVSFIESTSVDLFSFAQDGDLIGGKDCNNFKAGLSRKAMNSFFCKTDTPVEFKGSINEDVNTYTTLGSRGTKIFQLGCVSVHQQETQSKRGGMTETYKEQGTYVKSFYSVMSMPSAVRVSTMGMAHRRIHHKVYWDNCAPKVLNEKWRKER